MITITIFTHILQIIIPPQFTSDYCFKITKHSWEHTFEQKLYTFRKHKSHFITLPIYIILV